MEGPLFHEKDVTGTDRALAFGRLADGSVFALHDLSKEGMQEGEDRLKKKLDSSRVRELFCPP